MRRSCAGPGPDCRLPLHRSRDLRVDDDDAPLFVGCNAAKIVGARGPLDCGWDPVFEPDGGGGRTFAEMAKPDKNAISHWGRALAKLKDFLLVHFQGTETPRLVGTSSQRISKMTVLLLLLR